METFYKPKGRDTVFNKNCSKSLTASEQNTNHAFSKQQVNWMGICLSSVAVVISEYVMTMPLYPHYLSPLPESIRHFWGSEEASCTLGNPARPVLSGT